MPHHRVGNTIGQVEGDHKSTHGNIPHTGRMFWVGFAFIRGWLVCGLYHGMIRNAIPNPAEAP